MTRDPQHRTTDAAPESARAARIRRTDETLRQARRCKGAKRSDLLNEVVTLNLPVARSIAHQFRNRGEAAEDLEQVAYLGLVKAVHRFDPTKGEEFLSFAVPTIGGEVKRHFRDLAWSVRPPRRIQEIQGAISPAVQELLQELGRFPRASEIAERIDAEEDDVVEALACGGCFTPLSLDDRGPGGDGYQLADRLADRERGFQRAEAIAMLGSACRKLKPRDRRILYLRFYKGYTQEQIAAELGVTQMQVSRLLARILRDLRGAIQPVKVSA